MNVLVQLGQTWRDADKCPVCEIWRHLVARESSSWKLFYLPVQRGLQRNGKVRMCQLFLKLHMQYVSLFKKVSVLGSCMVDLHQQENPPDI